MNYVNDEKTLANFADNDKFYSDRMENRISPESSLWNPWHGCHKLSTGCRHCYVFVKHQNGADGEKDRQTPFQVAALTLHIVFSFVGPAGPDLLLYMIA